MEPRRGLYLLAYLIVGGLILFLSGIVLYSSLKYIKVYKESITVK